MNEKFSTYFDEEVNAAARSIATQELLGSAKLQQSWQRYNLLGSVLREETHQHNAAFAERIAAEVAAVPITPVHEQIATQVQQAQPAANNNRWAPVFAFATAASLAVAAVFFNQQPLSHNNLNGSGVAQGIAIAQQTNDAQSLGGTNNQLQTVSSQTADYGLPDQISELLVKHAEYGGTMGMNGLSAYARIVSNETPVRL